MAGALRDIRILGLHPVPQTQMEFDSALEMQWGVGLTGSQLAAAKWSVQQHFRKLFLIEIQAEPAQAPIDWSEVTQPDPELDISNWQVAYSITPIDQAKGRWAFFMHCLDLVNPILTPVGERILPDPTPTPRHLASIIYEVPG